MKKTEILVIADRSGSMNNLVQEVIGGYNRFLKEQKEVPGEARVTYTQFDDQYEVVYQGRPVAEAPELNALTFVPRGSTALNDAIGRTLSIQGERISKENWAELVIVYIMTDGGENASREYNLERVKEMTIHAEKHGWQFIYLAANQDAFATSRLYGSSSNNAMNFAANAAGATVGMASASFTATKLRFGDNSSLKDDEMKAIKVKLQKEGLPT